MLDATGAELTTWIFEAEDSEVEPGERVAFQTRALNPPPEAADVGVTFADPAELP